MHIAVFLLSAAILAYEVVLMRMFSISQWHHFASMIVSIALLGFGMSGTVFAIWREPLLARFRFFFPFCAISFLWLLPLCTWLAQRIPFTPFLIVWQGRQLLYLLAIYLLLVVPFTLGALAIGLALGRAREHGVVGKTYAMNLLGSGAGAIAGLLVCFLPVPARLSEYKGLEKAMVMADSRTVWTKHHPLGRVDLVESPALRVAPGLSIAYTDAMPKQQVIFVDGDGGSAVNLAAWDDEAMAYVAWLPSAASYQVLPARKVLVIGVGGGTELQQALRLGATQVIGVEMHPVVAKMAEQNVGGRLRRATEEEIRNPKSEAESARREAIRNESKIGNPKPALRDAKQCQIVVAEGRAFIGHSRDSYDLIQISLLDSLAATAAGVGAVNESYLYTVEALRECIERLTDCGVLSITRWLKTPPRDNLKMFATAVAALERTGVREPSRHLIFVRGWATGTLLVKRVPFTAEEIERVRRWAEERVFDVDYFPGATETDVNQRNVMAEPIYFHAAQAILSGEREQFYRDYAFNVRPASDDQPYFFHFFRWRSAPRLLREMGRQWIPFVEWGYVVLVATLAQAAVASVVLIGLPLLFVKRGAKNEMAERGNGRVRAGSGQAERGQTSEGRGRGDRTATGEQTEIGNCAATRDETGPKSAGGSTRPVKQIQHPESAQARRLMLPNSAASGTLASPEETLQRSEAPRSTLHAPRSATLLYFACLGLGFMFLEISLLQKFTLFLGNPLYSAAMVIASFLVFAGLGAMLMGKRVREARWPVAAIAVLALVYVAALPKIFDVFLAAGEAVRFAVSVALIAPLAFCMGTPFPLGLGRISTPLLPWAWAVNGCFSVIGAVLTSVLAIHFGFSTLIVTAAALYLLAGAVFPKLR